MTEEQWRSIPGQDGRYSASNTGRVLSLNQIKPRILKPGFTKYGHAYVTIRTAPGIGSSRYVHHLVLEAFIGPRPEGQITRHLNGDPSDNRLENLAYGTYSENLHDAVQHGTHASCRRTHCPHGHEYTPENTYLKWGRSRVCKTCHRAEEKRRYWRERLEA